jgi:glycosyltransferase involved in cell wall biosynthesis
MEASCAGKALRLPLVSIIITNHNYSQYVCAAIKSVQNQSYQNFECVVVDDCSNDGSFEIVDEYLGSVKDGRFRAIRLASNLGQMGAIKAGLQNTSGPFVHSLDADDLVFPDFLERHIEAHLNSSYSAGQTASDTIQIDAEGQILEATFHMLTKHRSDFPDGPVKPVFGGWLRHFDDGKIDLAGGPSDMLMHVDRELDGWHGVAMSSFVFRRDVLDLILPTNTDPFRICADYYLVKYVHTLAGTITIGSPHSCFRMHRRNGFSSNGLIGGQHLPAFFAPAHQQSLDAEIVRHLTDSKDRIQRVVGVDRYLSIIQKSLPRRAVEESGKRSRNPRQESSGAGAHKRRLRDRFAISLRGGN